jgi:hypothetical protein
MLKVLPTEVVTDAAPVYTGVLEEVVPSAWHHVEQYATDEDVKGASSSFGVRFSGDDARWYCHAGAGRVGGGVVWSGVLVAE